MSEEELTALALKAKKSAVEVKVLFLTIKPKVTRRRQ
jgi:hypothetical protein